MKVFQSRQYTEFVKQLGGLLSSDETLNQVFGPQMTKSEFEEHFERVHTIFKQSRVQNHKSKW